MIKLNKYNIITENKIKVLTTHTINAIFFYIANNEKFDENTTATYCIKFLEILENPEAMKEINEISEMITEICDGMTHDS